MVNVVGGAAADMEAKKKRPETQAIFPLNSENWQQS
jgi:hypothetical protein